MTDKTDAVRKRIKRLLRQRGTTEHRLADGDAALQVRLNNQLSHGARLTADTILTVLERFPDVSAEWLLRGTPTAPPAGSSGAAKQREKENRNKESI